MTDTVDTAVSPGYFRGRDIRSLAADLRSGRTTSVELVEHSLAAITRLDPILNAFTTVDTEGALAAARTADRERAEGRDRGVLHGIPVSVKDLIDIAGQVTTSGSLAHPRRAETDAECVSRLHAAGAVIVGKNVLHEFAYGATGDRSAHGASRNPWDVNRISGGSSGGSAVATAAGMVPLAVGTDTAGSVRVPAALCGVTGFKPAYGDIPTAGVHALAASLDHVGVFAATAGGVADAYAIMSGHTPDRSQVEPRVAWLDPAGFGPCDPAIATTVRDAMDEAGIAVEATARLPFPAGEAFSVLSVLQACEAYAERMDDLSGNEQIIDAEVVERLLRGRDTAAWQYVRADRRRDAFRSAIAGLFERFDVVAMPTVPTVATAIGQRAHEIGGQAVEVRSALLSLTCPWNLTGHPALSVPAGTVSGLPVGLQLITTRGAEQSLFDLAERIERR
ncbi:amidase [Mycolicibacterium mageritense]|uniref:1-carboxybiuret hydrolase subunit AtzE n=1 Tax=Mycolicibacterium mageritense TaxID=53462 RepID=A0AAI8TZ14_MYCME|nr:amidase [Mycolicibacterium mageritense]BDY31545.1 1-carboxybiuret hydrolase subunit AtzE [Mycolicibacterium mageritense]